MRRMSHVWVRSCISSGRMTLSLDLLAFSCSMRSCLQSLIGGTCRSLSCQYPAGFFHLLGQLRWPIGVLDALRHLDVGQRWARYCYSSGLACLQLWMLGAVMEWAVPGAAPE